jgi:hypothetical protein
VPAASAPDVSLVVLNWQDEAATARCVSSLRNLDGSARCEIIVVDNASTAASRAGLAALDDVRIVALETNEGFAGGMNAGIAAASAPYVALFNNDLIVERSWLSAGLRSLQSPEVGVVGGAALAWDGTGPPAADAAPLAMVHVDPDRGFAVLGAAPKTEKVVAAVDGSNVLGRRELLDRLGGFDPAYFAYGEDVDLCARAWALGYASLFNPAMKVWHRRGSSSDRVPRQRAFWAARNHMLTVAKHFPERSWGATVARVAREDLSAAVLGHPGGARARGSSPLGRDERLGLVQASWWAARHHRALRASRAATIAAGQHDEGYQGRLRALAIA